MAQFLNKDGMSLGYKGPHIYKSLKTAMKNYGKDADEVVEYAPIVKCWNCKHFVPEENVGDDDWEGKCLYNDIYVDTSDFCSRGEERRRKRKEDD